MSPKLTDPVRLRAILDRLVKQKAAAPLTPTEREALAECAFRLAVAADTPAPEAVRLLLRGRRLDGANPRYAYHLARIYLQHGDLDRAAAWLRRALAQCPTSHRIWAHVSLLQRELHARHHGDVRYDVEALRERGGKVEKAVRDGVDHLPADLSDFTPPMSEKLREEEANRRMERAMQEPFAEPPPADETPAPESPTPAVPRLPRIEKPGECRWSGIDDLLAEALLEAEPSNHKLDDLLPVMERAATAAARRPRGVSAFVILAIQWLVSGYPAETIRRLAAKLPAEPRPDLALLGRVCALFEAAEDDVPRLLAEAIQAGDLPPFLAALIHQRRVVWYPLRFEALGDYRAARRYLNAARRSPPKDEAAQKAQDEEVAEHVKKLRRGVKALYADPPRRLADRPPREATPADATPAASPAERLDGLEAQAADLAGRLDAAWPRLLALESAHKAGSLDEKGLDDLRAVAIDVEVAKAACGAGLRDIGEMRTGGGLTPEQATRAEKIERDLKKTATLGKFLKVLNKLPVPKIDPAALAPAPAGASNPGTAASSPAERLAALDAQAGAMKARFDADWPRLLDLEKASKTGPLDAKSLGELQAIAAHVEAGKPACTEALAAIGDLRKSGSLTPEEAGRLEKVERVFKDNATRPGKFRKVLDKLPVPPVTPALQPGPAAASAPAAATPAGAGQTPRQPRIGDDSLRGLAALEKALADADRELIRFYNAAGATFKPYPRAALRQPALHGLRGLVRARAAETFFRLGRRHLAREQWNALLCADRLDLDLLWNIAVCDTRDQDASRCLSSWRAYAEMLYFYDVVEGSPRPRAAARAAFHREFGNAFAPAFLQEKPDARRDEKADEAAFAVFLDSPGRVRHFVGHKLLELLNGKLDFRAPLWVLGVRKSDGPKARARARDGLVAFVESACALLPDRVRDAFQALCLNHIDAAAKACGSAYRLTPEKDPHYAGEEARHVQWLKEVVRFKKTLYLHVRGNETLYRHLRGLDFLDEFARLDAVPLDQSPDLLNAAALANGLTDGEVVLDLMGGLTDHVLFPLLEFVFKGTDVAEDDAFRQAQYGRLVGPWATNQALSRPRQAVGDRSYLDLIDEPSHFYPVEVTAAFKGEPTPRALELLREWVARYPRSTGPARHLAGLLAFGPKHRRAFDLANANDPAAVPLLIELIDDGMNAEALAVLEDAARAGVTEAGRAECRKVWGQLQQQALATVKNTVIIFQNLSANARLDPQRLSRSVNRWLDAWRERLRSWPTSEQGPPPVTGQDLTEVEEALDSAVVHAALHPLGDLNENWRGVANEMGRILKDKPTSRTALFYRMIAWHRLAVEASQKNDRDGVLGCLRQSRNDAQALLELSPTKEQRDQAQKLLQEISSIPGV